MALDPITREELFLAKIGGQSVTTPEPITREELFLQAIVDSGGGGAPDLPLSVESGLLCITFKEA